jgi:hypothetical protein
MVIRFLWVWWDTRNELNAGEQARPVAEVLHRATVMACSADYLNMQTKDTMGYKARDKEMDPSST